jgi:hypothetical protein
MFDAVTERECRIEGESLTFPAYPTIETGGDVCKLPLEALLQQRVGLRFISEAGCGT